jgi:hypothetical protein
VLVFDPLALMMVIAANQSRIWDNEEYKKEQEEQKPQYEPDDGPINKEALEALRKHAEDVDLFPTFEEITPKPVVEESIPCYKCGTTLVNAPGIGPFCPNKECDVVDNTEGVELEFTEPEIKKPNFSNNNYVMTEPTITFGEQKPIIKMHEPTVDSELTVDSVEPIATEGVTQQKPYEELDGGYVVYDGKHMSMDVLKNMRPDVLKLVADNQRESNPSFGTEFPRLANKGDTFVRVDVLPNRVYKFDGTRWISVNKENSSYLHDEEYIKYLIQKIDNGEYDVELLSDSEKEQIEEYLTKKDDKK